MLSPKIELRDMDENQLKNLFSLFDPLEDKPSQNGMKSSGVWGALGSLQALVSTVSNRPIDPHSVSGEQGAVIFFEQGVPLAGYKIGGEPLMVDQLSGWSQDALAALRQSLKLPYVVALEMSQFPTLLETVQQTISPFGTAMEQEYKALGLIKESAGVAFLVDPPIPFQFPLPPQAILKSTVDSLFPDDRSIVLYVTDNGSLFTSLIIQKKAGEIVYVGGHPAISDCASFTSIRDDSKRLVEAVARRFSPVHIGFFVSRRSFAKLLDGDFASLTLALSNKQAVLDPAPTWLKALLGLGAVSEVASKGTQLATSFLSATKFGSKWLPEALSSGAQKLFNQKGSPFEALGIDPFEVLYFIRDWTRRLKLDREAFKAATITD